MSEHTPFLEIFPGCADLAAFSGGLDKAYVTDVQVDASELTMTVAAWFAAMPSPAELQTLSERLKADYGLSGVGMAPDFPRRPAKPPPPATRRRATCSTAAR